MAQEAKLVTKTKSRIPQREVSLTSPQAVQKFANQLKEFIVANKLYSEIQGKNYAHVEGWQFAGMATGQYPRVTKLDDLSHLQDGLYKYRAEVELVHIKSGKITGYGIAICSTTEDNFKDKPEYVIASMAQTRAIGKAFRNQLAFVMKLAGYEPVPVEEITEEILDNVELKLKIKDAETNFHNKK